MSNASLTDWLHAVAEPANKKILVVTTEFMEALEKHFYRSGKTSVAVADVNLEPIFISFAMTPFNPFFEEFSEKIQRLVEAGICPDRLAGRTSNAKLRNKLFDEEVPALVLSMDDLGVGFEVCLIPLIMSAVAFFVEVIYSKLKATVQEYFAAMYAVAAFIRIRQVAM